MYLEYEDRNDFVQRVWYIVLKKNKCSNPFCSNTKILLQFDFAHASTWSTTCSDRKTCDVLEVACNFQTKISKSLKVIEKDFLLVQTLVKLPKFLLGSSVFLLENSSLSKELCLISLVRMSLHPGYARPGYLIGFLLLQRSPPPGDV